MERLLNLRRVCVVLVALVLLASTQGCTYLGNRGHDAAQMLDLGFTFTKTPQFGIYANCPLVTPVGYSKIDGYYVGMGGGKLGVMKHHQNNEGLLLWGKEENSWEQANSREPKTEQKARAGVVGLAQGLKNGENDYKPTCVHYLHLGWVGVAANFKYYEMYDFAAGCLGFDPAGDDRKAPAATMVAKAETKPPVAPRLAAPKPAPAAVEEPKPAPVAAEKPKPAPVALVEPKPARSTALVKAEPEPAPRVRRFTIELLVP